MYSKKAIDVVDQIKEQLCYTALNLEKERALALETTVLVEKFTVPEKQSSLLEYNNLIKKCKNIRSKSLISLSIIFMICTFIGLSMVVSNIYKNNACSTIGIIIYCIVSIFLFILGISNLIRIFYGWNITINKYNIPVWASFIGLLYLIVSFKIMVLIIKSIVT